MRDGVLGHGAWGMGHGAWGMGHGAWGSHCGGRERLHIIKWRHGKDSPMPYAPSRRATVPRKTPGDGVSRRLSMNPASSLLPNNYALVRIL